MPPRRPQRLASFDYLGCWRYFVTCCCFDRQRLFLTPAIVECVQTEFLRTADERAFTSLVAVFMPDHFHALVEGTTDDADFKQFMKLMRMKTAFAVASGYRRRLWQDGYFEHVLRDEETTPAVVAYIVANPVRAGLVDCVDEYSYTYVHSELGRPSDVGRIDGRRT